MQHRHEAERSDLAGNLSDPDRPAELVGAFAASEKAADEGECPVDNRPRFLGAEPDRLQCIDVLGFEIAWGSRLTAPEYPLAGVVAEAVLASRERGRRRQRHR